MPGLFSWKPKIKGRKTPEIDRAMSPIDYQQHPRRSTTPNDLKRFVRFDETGTAAMQPIRTTAYSNGAKIQVAPLAETEFDESADGRSSNASRMVYNRTNMYEASNSETQVFPTNDEQLLLGGNRRDRAAGFIYLEVNGEVKKAALPSAIQSMDTVRALFLRSFPNLTSLYLSQERVKIYIQEPSKGQLFYELDDLRPSSLTVYRDIKNRTVLKLREQISGYQSPQPIRFTDHPPVEYISESELELMEYRSRLPAHRGGSYRASSALDSRQYSVMSGPKKPIRPSVAPRFDGYCDQYTSDTSSKDTRSGSVTPVVDREARFRMETMERQLAGLSSLVHSALVSKGMTESSQRDMQELRQQIMALHPDVDSSSVPSSKEPSLADSSTPNPGMQHEFIKLKRNVTETRNDMKHLHHYVKKNSHDIDCLLAEATDTINNYLVRCTNSLAKSGKKLEKPNYSLVDYTSRISMAQKSIRQFEDEVEDVRKLVLNTNRKLKISEVEAFTETLTRIGRSSAQLKSQFPELQRLVEANIKRNMESVVDEERFLKEEAKHIDQCLYRCKALANMMVTMKKLAMLQDPSMKNTPFKSGNKINIDSSEVRKSAVNTSAMMETKGETDGARKTDLSLGQTPRRSSRSPRPTMNMEIYDHHQLLPPVPPAPSNYNSPSTSEKSDVHVLDAIMDELTNTVEMERKERSLYQTQTAKPCPPKPPERFSTIDARNRYTPTRIRELQRSSMNSTPTSSSFAIQATYISNGIGSSDSKSDTSSAALNTTNNLVRINGECV